MYNRYVRNDRGVYTRIPLEESSPQPAPHASHPEERVYSTPSPGHQGHPEGEFTFPHPKELPPNHRPQQKPPHTGHHSGAFPGPSDALRNLLNRFHLENVDTGDLLLLLLLFLLFKEDADEELLFALGLLLIL